MPVVFGCFTDIFNNSRTNGSSAGCFHPCRRGIERTSGPPTFLSIIYLLETQNQTTQKKDRRPFNGQRLCFSNNRPYLKVNKMPKYTYKTIKMSDSREGRRSLLFGFWTFPKEEQQINPHFTAQNNDWCMFLRGGFSVAKDADAMGPLSETLNVIYVTST